MRQFVYKKKSLGTGLELAKPASVVARFYTTQPGASDDESEERLQKRRKLNEVGSRLETVPKTNPKTTNWAQNIASNGMILFLHAKDAPTVERTVKQPKLSVAPTT